LTVPDLRWKEAQGKDLDWYEKALGDGNPVFIYFHGNTKNRYDKIHFSCQVLSALGYHVVVPDYRGFGDSTGEITEEGATTDSLYVYNWVKARSGSSLVVIWGHSLGTACVQIISHIFVKCCVVLDGVILEGTFNAARSKIPVNPLIWVVATDFLPEKLHSAPFNVFSISPHFFILYFCFGSLKKMKSPILFLHAEDDSSVPIETAET
ncbi:hypothetical protein NL108_018026, partial [Boleophthalmus pectinirostris]